MECCLSDGGAAPMWLQNNAGLRQNFQRVSEPSGLCSHHTAHSTVPCRNGQVYLDRRGHSAWCLDSCSYPCYSVDWLLQSLNMSGVLVAFFSSSSLVLFMCFIWEGFFPAFVLVVYYYNMLLSFALTAQPSPPHLLVFVAVI